MTRPHVPALDARVPLTKGQAEALRQEWAHLYIVLKYDQGRPALKLSLGPLVPRFTPTGHVARRMHLFLPRFREQQPPQPAEQAEPQPALFDDRPLRRQPPLELEGDATS